MRERDEAQPLFPFSLSGHNRSHVVRVMTDVA